MASETKIVVCGGDKRYIKTYQLFRENGYPAAYSDFDSLNTLRNFDIIILPITSFDREGNINGTSYTVYDFFNTIKSGSYIFAGKVPNIIKRIADEHKIHLYDYTDNEEFNLLNAVTTAEGAILTVLNKSENTISHSKFTVLGYGRIGRSLALRLRALGGDVSVGARSIAARANAYSDSISSKSITEAIYDCTTNEIIFNTIPSPIIDHTIAEKLKNNLIIDLASIPGGLTEQAKHIMEDNYIHALSLPGKHFPATAGETIFKTITSILIEKGVM